MKTKYSIYYYCIFLNDFLPEVPEKSEENLMHVTALSK